jgi:hypothetical protein
MGDEQYELRLSALERWRILAEVSLGKLDVDKEYINKRFDKIEENLKEINNSAKRLNYMVWAAVIGYILKFVVEGGLTHI